jgi:two-component system, LytTR family, response regulator
VNALRCLIVDDERLARDSLRELLREMPGVEIAGEAGRVEEGVAAVRDLRPDVLLLDVQMPAGGGFELLRRLEEPPAVIFVTAYDRHAVRAFEVHAVDYLLKPVEPARLAEALGRVRRRADGPGDPLPPAHKPAPLAIDDAVLLELGRSGHFRTVADILAVRADGKYTNVLCADGSHYLVRQSLSEWNRRLPPELFVQLERGLIVHLSAIRSAHFRTRKATFALGAIERVFEVGREAAKKLRRLLER